MLEIRIPSRWGKKSDLEFFISYNLPSKTVELLSTNGGEIMVCFYDANADNIYLKSFSSEN